MLAVTLSAGRDSSNPTTFSSWAGLIVSPGTRTVRPIRLAACDIWLVPRLAAIACRLPFMFSMPCTVLSWAIWLVTCALSSGFSGSWFFIWATSRLRKRFCVSATLLFEDVDALAPNRLFTLLVSCTVLMVVPRYRCCSLSQAQGLEQQGLGGVHHVHVGLVRARGGDHVDHFLHHIDVGHGHVAFLVGERILGVVHLLHR